MRTRNATYHVTGENKKAHTSWFICSVSCDIICIV